MGVYRYVSHNFPRRIPGALVVNRMGGPDAPGRPAPCPSLSPRQALKQLSMRTCLSPFSGEARYVRPTRTTGDVADGARMNTERTRYARLALAATEPFNDQTDSFGSELGHPGPLASRLPTLLDFVSVVDEAVAEKQVRRIHARWFVAVMEYAHPWRNRAAVHLPRQPMSGCRPAWRQRSIAVTTRALPGRPQPAPGGLLFNMPPEADLRRRATAIVVAGGHQLTPAAFH